MLKYIIFGILLAFAVYAGSVMMIAEIKHVDVKKARKIFWKGLLDLIGFFETDIPLGMEDRADILSVIWEFSSLKPKNTRYAVNPFPEIPTFRAEILDPNFMEHWEVIEGNLYRVFNRMFAYRGVEGDAYITYERTSRNSQYQIVAYWATTRRSRKKLAELRQNILEYDRRMDEEKSAPFIDRELEKEMENLEDGYKD